MKYGFIDILSDILGIIVGILCISEGLYNQIINEKSNITKIVFGILIFIIKTVHLRDKKKN